MNYLSVQDLGKSYGIQTLFKGLNFGVDQGQKVALVARNGTGKTTILRALAGLEPPDKGKIVYRKGIQAHCATSTICCTASTWQFRILAQLRIQNFWRLVG